ncbi:MSHA biogenesis protein MshP [Shewanella sp. 202IG2-18]|uniref:MSHA biogenesis protein MshP n=1 Tax=Parashewanella hymeniacidonis TaxID=2807618 RepID=UPI00196224E0|nr:MSHA biogenesis protein MshP [Parashewanella hymeniacidonis]MBM7073069.1 MSHA biogenesis protein MshP [Parashewanella hymeniacidonis]
MFHRQPASLKNQKGSMLILGIFILTVMFLLAAALINISQNSDEAINQEVLGTRALFAANSGADAALSDLFGVHGRAANCANVGIMWNAPNSALSLLNCEPIQRTCRAFNTTVASKTVTQYRITSKAVCGSNEHRVSRQVEVIARDEI